MAKHPKYVHRNFSMGIGIPWDMLKTFMEPGIGKPEDIDKPEQSINEIISKIPTLSGQICGDFITWGHLITPRNTVYSQRLWLECSCGWRSEDLCYPNSIFFGNMITEIVMKHIPNASFDEIEYTTITMGWLQDLPRHISRNFLQFLETSGAIIHLELDAGTYIIIDDNMTDEAVAYLSEFLEGHPIGVRKLKVLKNG